jgi:hypothetical protein
VVAEFSARNGYQLDVPDLSQQAPPERRRDIGTKRKAT